MGSVSGYDSLKLNHSLILDLRMREGTGTFTRDWGDSHHDMAWAATPTWTNETGGASSLTFAAGDYLYLGIAAGADFDFTTEDMSMCAWVYSADDPAGARVLIARGLENVGGWEWYYASSNLAFRTNQTGSRCGSAALSVITVNQWVFFAFVRKGLFGQFYVNGLPIPSIQSVNGLLDPVTINEVFYVANNSHADNFVGKLWHPRVWNRRLTDTEVAGIWEKERGLWGL